MRKLHIIPEQNVHKQNISEQKPHWAPGSGQHFHVLHQLVLLAILSLLINGQPAGINVYHYEQSLVTIFALQWVNQT